MSSMQKFISSCLVSASREIEKARRAGLTIKEKGRNDMATSADLASEKLIVSRIRRNYPDSCVLSEESYTQADLSAHSLFVLDPIDGTHNFIAGIPLYGISLAHYSGGRPTAGGIYLAPQKILMYAEAGKAATANGRKISVSKKSRLEDFFMLCDSRLHLAEEQGLMPGLLRLEKVSQHTRFIGSAIYEMGYVACGMAEAELDFRLKPYDFAAAAFIAGQAGAKITDLEGRPWSLKTTRFLCSNGKQHQRILNILHEK